MTLLAALWIASMSQVPPPAPATDLREQIACAPIGRPAPPVAGLRLLGGYVHGRRMFGSGDAVIVNAGTLQGVQTGQQYFVRRPVPEYAVRPSKVDPIYGVHTAGWITIVDAKDTMAVATVTHACDGVIEGDYLEPYVEPALPTTALPGAPDFEHPGRIVLADERRQMGYPGLLMVMNRGSEAGVRAGQGLTIYRPTLDGQGPVIDVGRATVLSVGAQNALVRIDSAREPVNIGDLVAIHRITQ